MAFEKSTEVVTGLKVLAFGNTGCGKSFFGLTFPDIAEIDSEAGVRFYTNGVTIGGKHYNNMKLIDQTSSIEDLEEDLRLILNDDPSMKGIKSVVIDSETKFYNQLQTASLEVEERRARNNGNDVADATVSQRQWGKIKLITSRIQQLKIDLSSKGIHVVSTAQMADLRDKKDSSIVLGDKPDMHKSTPYDYDIVLKFVSRPDPKDNKMRFYAKVLKDRTETFLTGQEIENATYDLWANVAKNYDSKHATKVESTYNTSFDKDVQKMENDAMSSSTIAKDVTSIIKSSSQENKVRIADKMKQLGLTPKIMSAAPSDVLTELLTFCQSL